MCTDTTVCLSARWAGQESCCFAAHTAAQAVGYGCWKPRAPESYIEGPVLMFLLPVGKQNDVGSPARGKSLGVEETLRKASTKW